MLSYSASGYEVDTSIINGNIVMEKGKILALDEEEIYNKIRKTHKSLLSR